MELSALDGTNGFQINGEAAADYAGRSVSAAGDVNGDGFADILIGAPGADPNGNGSGASYVVFGHASGFAANLDLSALNGTNGFQISGVAAGDISGNSVSTAGDVNGDGYADLIIGAHLADPNGNGSGASYVVFGHASGFAANLDLSALNGTNGFRIYGEVAGDYSGFSVSEAGDVNGDGLDDLLVSAPNADPNGTNTGASYVVFGQAGGFGANLHLSALNGTNGFQINGEATFDYAGFQVSSAGDVNGDGFADLIIGAVRADPNGPYSGASYVVFGQAGGFGANLNLSSLNGANGFQISGESAADFSGNSVSGAGDVNGDGFADLLIGAFGPDTNGYRSGASYVVFGHASGFAANLELAALNGTNGFKINGEAAGDLLGADVSAAGDVNGDGFDDFIIGAVYADPNGDRSGASYVVFGQAGGFGATLDLSSLTGANGFQISGEAAGDHLGVSVSAAGDVNGDGFDDLLVGALYADPNGDKSGASYVVFGSDLSGVVDSEGTSGNDSLTGDGNANVYVVGLGDDTLDGAGGADVLKGGGGDDWLIGGAGGDWLDGGLGFDIASFASEASAVSVNLGIGRANGASSGSDFLDGVEGVVGSAFNDTLAGGSSSDLLDGGAGDDTLTGGASGDVFRIAAGNGTDRITDFSGQDVIDVSGVALVGPVTSGDGSTVLAGEVQVSSGGGVTTLHIGVDANAGADLTVLLSGTFATIDLGVVNGNLAVGVLAGLDGTNGFQINGEAAGDTLGRSVSAAGDVNGDGFADVIISANFADPNGNESGASYVVFGQAGGFGANLELSSLTGANGFQISGEAAGDRSGISVSGAGDVNGDGFADLIIGANLADPNGNESGASYVVFGHASGFAANLDLSALNGTNGFRIDGETADDFSGFSVSEAGDVNGDGFADLIISAPNADPNGGNSGASYVVFGQAGGFGANLNLSSLNGANGFQISGEAFYDSSGFSVSSAGDVNGDGFGDVIIGAVRASPNGPSSGASYVVFGQAGGFGANLNLSSLNGTNGFQISGESASDFSGNSVSGAGDVNGDGFDDLVIGAFGPDTNGYRSGASYVVFGHAPGFTANFDLSALNGTNGFKIDGEAAGDLLGTGVSAVGDVNGDGFDDFIINAVSADPNGTNSGASYVVFGQAGGFGANLDLSSLTGANGFQISGEAAGDYSGASVSAAGDVNGDGFDDLIVSAAYADPNGSGSGASYVVFGGDFSGSVDYLDTNADNTTQTGSALAENFVTAQGNDTITGGGGADVFRAGSGNDRIQVSSTGFADADGGSGTDTLALTGSGMTLNLTLLANNRTSGIEVIELTGTGNNTLTLTALDLLDLSDSSNTLTVDGNALDTVTATGTWTDLGSINGYHSYSQGAAILKASTAVTFSGTVVNVAPVLNAVATPAGVAVLEDAVAPSGAVGTLVSALVNLNPPVGGLDNVTDSEGAAMGIAVTAADAANGTWHYSVNDGATWLALGAVSDGSSRLLAADADNRLYFQPTANYDGQANITFRAWDTTSGTDGGTANTTSNGGTTPFSSATDTAAFDVTPVNATPTVANPISDKSIQQGGTFTFSVSLFTFTDEEDGAPPINLAYSATLDDGPLDGTWLVFNPGDAANGIQPSFIGTPPGAAGTTYILKLIATDPGDASAEEPFTLSVTSAGGGGINTIPGTSGDDNLAGTSGDDSFQGGAGADTMTGGIGDDSYDVDNVGDLVVETLGGGEGIDVVRSSLGDYTLPDSVEILILNGGGNPNGTGNSLSNQITGNSGDNRLDGGLLDDILTGGLGNDVYVVDNPNDQINEADSAGIDKVEASVSFALPNTGNNYYVENLTLLSGAGNINATGNALQNTLTGNAGNNGLVGGDGNDTLIGGAGNDTLDGGAGADSLVGGAGNDTYYVDDSGDAVVEISALDGIDVVHSTVLPGWTLGANVEHLFLDGSSDINGIGNNLANQLIGNSGSNHLIGLNGDDLLKGADTLTGNTGADTLEGGLGNDLYYIDSADDLVIEQDGEGTADQIFATPNASLTSFTLPDYVETVTVVDPLALFIAGNGLNNFFHGNNGDDSLNGASGNDTLDGAGGRDTLDGGAGADSLVGGSGNDLYYVDDAGDLVIELNNNLPGGLILPGLSGGSVKPGLQVIFLSGITDTVIAAVNYSLANLDYVEHLTLTGTAAEGTGNTLANEIVGNTFANLLLSLDGDDYLAGGAGNDTLDGGAGNDTLTGGTENDVVSGGDGDDIAFGSAGDDSLMGGLGSDNLQGNAGIDTLIGNGGADTLDGGADADLIYGSVDDDSILGAAGIDTLVGNAGNDTINGGVDNDQVFGSVGDDYVLGGLGADVVQGNAGNDTVIGGDGTGTDTLDGNDSLDGGAGNDSLSGGFGNDNLVAGAGFDTLIGNAGNDTLDGGADGDLAYGSAGDDSIVGSAGIDTLVGNANNDTLDGGADDDQVFGSIGNDLVLGGAGNDVVQGNAGFDTIIGGAGNDTMQGNADTDVFRYDAATLNTLDVAAGQADFVSGTAAGDLISMLGLNDELTINGTALSALTANAAVGNALDATNNIAFTGGVLQIDLDGDDAFNALNDFQVQLTGVTSVTCFQSDGLFHLA